jgi:hypothetical protein
MPCTNKGANRWEQFVSIGMSTRPPKNYKYILNQNLFSENCWVESECFLFYNKDVSLHKRRYVYLRWSLLLYETQLDILALSVSVMKVIPETRRVHWIWCPRFYYHHWVDTSAGGLLGGNDLLTWRGWGGGGGGVMFFF